MTEGIHPGKLLLDKSVEDLKLRSLSNLYVRVNAAKDGVIVESGYYSKDSINIAQLPETPSAFASYATAGHFIPTIIVLDDAAQIKHRQGSEVLLGATFTMPALVDGDTALAFVPIPAGQTLNQVDVTQFRNISGLNIIAGGVGGKLAGFPIQSGSPSDTEILKFDSIASEWKFSTDLNDGASSGGGSSTGPGIIFLNSGTSDADPANTLEAVSIGRAIGSPAFTPAGTSRYNFTPFRVPADYVPGTDFELQLDFVTEDNSGNAAVFQISYDITSDGEAQDGQFDGATAQETIAIPAVADQQLSINSTALILPGTGLNVDDVITVSLLRLGDDGTDTHAGRLGLLGSAIRYTKLGGVGVSAGEYAGSIYLNGGLSDDTNPVVAVDVGKAKGLAGFSGSALSRINFHPFNIPADWVVGSDIFVELSLASVGTSGGSARFELVYDHTANGDLQEGLYDMVTVAEIIPIPATAEERTYHRSNVLKLANNNLAPGKSISVSIRRDGAAASDTNSDVVVLLNAQLIYSKIIGAGGGSGSGDLLAANNLSDVLSKQTSVNNLLDTAGTGSVLDTKAAPNKIRFDYATIASLPPAGDYRGMVAFVQSEARLYHSDGTSWVADAKLSEAGAGGSSTAKGLITLNGGFSDTTFPVLGNDIGNLLAQPTFAGTGISKFNFTAFRVPPDYVLGSALEFQLDMVTDGATGGNAKFDVSYDITLAGQPQDGLADGATVTDTITLPAATGQQLAVTTTTLTIPGGTITREHLITASLKRDGDATADTNDEAVTLVFAGIKYTRDGGTGGSGSGDLLAVNNLNDVDNTQTALDNLVNKGGVGNTIDTKAKENKLRFNYDTLSALPDANAYHGMIAHVHSEGRLYFAHNGVWTGAANQSELSIGGSTGPGIVNLEVLNSDATNPAGTYTLGNLTGLVSFPQTVQSTVHSLPIRVPNDYSNGTDIHVMLDIAPQGTSGGACKFEVNYEVRATGQTQDGVASSGPLNAVITLPSVQNEQVIMTTANFVIPAAELARDRNIILSISRRGDDGVNDTSTDPIGLINASLKYTKSSGDGGGTADFTEVIKLPNWSVDATNPGTITTIGKAKNLMSFAQSGSPTFNADVFVMPLEWQSTTDVILAIDFVADGVSGGNVRWIANYAVDGEGSVFTGNYSGHTQPGTVAVPAQANEIKTVFLTLPAVDFSMNKEVSLSLVRDGDNAADTNTDTIIIINAFLKFQKRIVVTP